MATSAPKTIGSRDAIQQARANIVAFLIVQAGLGSIFYVLLARQGSLSSTGGVLTLGLTWCPALAAGLASRFPHIPDREFGTLDDRATLRSDMSYQSYVVNAVSLSLWDFWIRSPAQSSTPDVSHFR